ncbi:MAG: T9SS type A sorting domain-containing protein [Taibaiella sp.]|nr:T9SS type A sorting domain-containing protein [Taibaiella sp.]
MKRYLLLFFAYMIMTTNLSAQIWEGIPYDSVIIKIPDSAHLNYTPDTASSPLWHIGKTIKPFFTSDTNGIKAIMTDTLNYYPILADNWFTLKNKYSFYNVIIGIWHRYETDSNMDGGTVEFSLDGGTIWQNVVGDCNVDGSLSFFTSGVRTENFYSKSDTLLNGIPAFSGKTNLPRFSRFQFSHGYLSNFPPLCDFTSYYSIRFKFMSDSTADTLAGWIIDSIKIERDRYMVSVDKINITDILTPSPNPSNSGLFTFPEHPEETHFSIEVYNTLGQGVIRTPYTHSFNLSKFPKGLYYYRVTDGSEYYGGKLLYE